MSWAYINAKSHSVVCDNRHSAYLCGVWYSGDRAKCDTPKLNIDSPESDAESDHYHLRPPDSNANANC
jgi:hypothetical protein